MHPSAPFAVGVREQRTPAELDVLRVEGADGFVSFFGARGRDRRDRRFYVRELQLEHRVGGRLDLRRARAVLSLIFDCGLGLGGCVRLRRGVQLV